jgi:hypothetical protein
MKVSSSQRAATSRLFSSAVLRELGRYGRSPIFARLMREANLTVRKGARVADVFDAALMFLTKSEFRDEYVYRAALTKRVLLGTHSLQTASMLSEFRVGTCRADVAVLNGTSTVYEIKSERDSLSKLERQVSAYRDVFATIYVIAGENHIQAVLKTVPKDVGVMKLSARYQISCLREAANAPQRTRPLSILDSLRTTEARALLNSVGLPLPTVPNTELRAALGQLFEKLDPTVVHDEMVRTLKRTRSLLSLADLIDELPESLCAAALAVPLRRADHSRLVQAVHTPVSAAASWA